MRAGICSTSVSILLLLALGSISPSDAFAWELGARYYAGYSHTQERFAGYGGGLSVALIRAPRPNLQLVFRAGAGRYDYEYSSMIPERTRPRMRTNSLDVEFAIRAIEHADEAKFREYMTLSVYSRAFLMGDGYGTDAHGGFGVGFGELVRLSASLGLIIETGMTLGGSYDILVPISLGLQFGGG
jgi:hypothetical protein